MKACIYICENVVSPDKKVVLNVEGFLTVLIQWSVRLLLMLSTVLI